MLLSVIALADAAPVSLEEAKLHCEAADFPDDDQKIEIYLAAATEYAAEYCSRVLKPTTYRAELCDWWSGSLYIPLKPVRDVIEVRYLDQDGATQVLTEGTDWSWRRMGDGCAVDLKSAFARPAVLGDRQDAVQVDVRAGYDNPDETGAGDDPELVLPVRLKQAILMLTEYWYRQRGGVSEKNLKAAPLAIDSLLNQARIYR